MMMMMMMAAGHSLGGALATLAAIDIRRHLQLTNIHVVTFGAPRTGNRAFALEYQRLVPDTWHVINARVSHPCIPSLHSRQLSPHKYQCLVPHTWHVINARVSHPCILFFALFKIECAEVPVPGP